jgi:hypothetical protein
MKKDTDVVAILLSLAIIFSAGALTFILLGV